MNDQSWSGLALPMLTITGTRDRGSRGQGVDWKQQAFRMAPPGGKHLVVIEGASHFHFGGRFAGRRRLRQNPDVPSPERMTTLVKAASVAFLDSHLKASVAAEQYLARGFEQEAGTHATIESR